MKPKYCIKCGRVIPEKRIKQYKKRKVATCSKRCALNRDQKNKK